MNVRVREMSTVVHVETSDRGTDNYEIEVNRDEPGKLLITIGCQDYSLAEWRKRGRQIVYENICDRPRIEDSKVLELANGQGLSRKEALNEFQALWDEAHELSDDEKERLDKHVELLNTVLDMIETVMTIGHKPPRKRAAKKKAVPKKGASKKAAVANE